MIIKNKRGFTLIELLVVIAIIGILASMVIVNVSSARDKAKDAVIKSSVSQVRAVAELSKDDNGDFDGVCGESDITGKISNNISENGGTMICNDNASEYCVSSVLNNGTSVCVDDFKTLKTGSCGTGTSCP